MKLERVSVNVAKAIKEAGYPQDYHTTIYYSNESEDAFGYGYQEGDEVSYDVVHKNQIEAIAAPTYLEVWLWLWREKGIRFDVEDLWNAEFSYPERGCASNTNQLGGICTPEVSDPEEAIKMAIEYLVDNCLIK